jgi:hypothetical protein
LIDYDCDYIIGLASANANSDTIRLGNNDPPAAVDWCYAKPEDVLRRALEAQRAEDDWTAEDRPALDCKLKRSIHQVSAGKTHGPAEARRMFADMRAAHLANLGR